MNSLSRTSWFSRFLRGGLASALLGLLAPMELAAEECNASPVYAFSRALYQQQYTRAAVLLEQVRHERSAQTASFLEQVLDFSRAYQQSDERGIREALRTLDSLINTFPDYAADQPPDASLLDQASIRIHAARMHLLSGNLLRAVALGKDAGHILAVHAEQGQTADALLAWGLYQYYAGRGDDDLGWVIGLFGFRGDKVAGIDNMIKAAQQSPDHAFEAVRSLISDLGWNRQQLCPVLSAFDQVSSAGHPSPIHYQQQVAAFLFCGNPLQALELIKTAESMAAQDKLHLDSFQQEWLFDARLHTYAVLGDTLQLEELLRDVSSAEPQSRMKISFALARALDVQGQRHRAQAIYTRLLETSPGALYQKMARLYLENGFRAPEPFNGSLELPLLTACAP